MFCNFDEKVHFHVVFTYKMIKLKEKKYILCYN